MQNGYLHPTMNINPVPDGEHLFRLEEEEYNYIAVYVFHIT